MKSFKLLVVDDSLTIRKLVELSFRGMPPVVVFAASGREAVAKAFEAPPDVILLDYVLPDMKALDVWQRLAEDERTAATPIILMSAKHENIRHEFRACASVVDFIGKPFTSDDIRARIDKALGAKAHASTVRPPSGVASNPVLFTPAQRESAALTLFVLLRKRFAMIPQWINEMGTTSPAKFFARKILTAGLMDEVLDALLPVFREVLSQQLLDARGPGPQSMSGSPLEGHMNGWSVIDLLKLVTASGRTGELSLADGDRTTVVYFRGGDPILVTNRSPREYVHAATLNLSAVSTAAREHAEAEQAMTGKPLYVSLAEAGKLPPCNLTALLNQQGKRALVHLLDAPSIRFSFRGDPALPLYVEAYGQRIMLSQLSLERLRKVTSLSELNPTGATEASVFERSPGFSKKITSFDLSSHERRVLTLIDGKTSIQAMSTRAGQSADEVLRIALRLASVDLVRPRAAVAPTVGMGPAKRSQVMILEPDTAGFNAPLENLLKKRPEPLHLVNLRGESDIVAALRRARPRLVIINASTPGADAENIARAVRSAADLADLSLVAVLESEQTEQIDELSAAGFDSILVKPIHYAEIERMLAA